MDMTPNTLTIEEIHRAFRENEFTCTDLIESCLDRIERVEPAVAAFVTVLEEDARISARAVDEKIRKKLPFRQLEGIPVALKDNMMVAGVRTTCSSKILSDYHASYDATVVQKLRDAGAIIIGKTNLDEFAMGSSTENSAFGPSKNPWDTSRVPGGSSGGSAVAVSADECVVSLGSDTGGSVRLPAGLTGVVGFKPTYGTVSRYGLIAMASTLDQIGPFGRTVADVTTVFDVIKGADPHDSSSQRAQSLPVYGGLRREIKGLRIGIPKEYFGEGVDDDVRDRVLEAIEVLKNLGAEIKEISLPLSKYALSVYYVLMPAEVSANLARFDGIRYGFSSPDAKNLYDVYAQSRENGFGAEVRRRLMLGAYVLSSGYADAFYKQAEKVRMMVVNDFKEAFKEVDVCVTPITPTPAFPLGEKGDDPLKMYLADIFTVSANIAGIPGLSVPCGFVNRGATKLPVGMQILGLHFDDATVLRVGSAYEQATDWHNEKPPL